MEEFGVMQLGWCAANKAEWIGDELNHAEAVLREKALLAMRSKLPGRPKQQQTETTIRSIGRVQQGKVAHDDLSELGLAAESIVVFAADTAGTEENVATPRVAAATPASMLTVTTTERLLGCTVNSLGVVRRSRSVALWPTEANAALGGGMQSGLATPMEADREEDNNKPRPQRDAMS